MIDRKEHGFTIVELLIVIVVIGILASITIVAYNGIQDRAKNTRYQVDANALSKGAELIAADGGGVYPNGTTDIALTNSFSSSIIFKIPSGVAVKYISTPLAIDATNNNAAIALADGVAPNYTRTYNVDPCGTAGAGLKIYYPVRGGTLQVISAGNVTTGC